MSIFTLRAALVFVGVVLNLFADKLFKQHAKKGRIICDVILLVAYLLTYL